jgi:ABC-type transport system substrate-binding protein
MDAGNWWDYIWESHWNITGDANGDPTTWVEGVDGWDFFFEEWWLNPNSYIWLDELVYSWNMIDDGGWNVMSWNDLRSDSLYQRAMTASTPAIHKNLMWRWQQYFMHNPPVIPMFYFKLYTARASYLNGWDDTVWLYDLSQLDINETNFDLVAPPTRQAQGSDTIIWGAVEPIYTWYPLGTLTYTEETVNVLTNGLLYYLSRENMAGFPSTGAFTTKLGLASDFPTWRQEVDPQQGGQTVYVARVPIRTGIKWTDDVDFNASDVAFSYNAILQTNAHCLSRGDYWFLYDRVNVVSPYVVDFYYKPGQGPDFDFAGYQSHGWARGMMPWHILKDVNPAQWANYYADPVPQGYGGTGLPVLGPYIPTSWNEATQVLELEKNMTLGFEAAMGWSGNLPNNFIIRILPDAFERKSELASLGVDFCEYPTAEDTWWEALPNGTETDMLRVYSYAYPSSHPLWMNLRNPILSNRYVRLAIAHAIPYQQIIDNVLPGWGIDEGYPGKSFLTPWHEYFNTAIDSFSYDIDKAKMYMDMWRYSQAGTDYTKGPVGDHDLSGYVDVADFSTWAEKFGTGEADWTATMWGGNNIDPDSNNDNLVDLDDYDPCWRTNVNKYYPYPGAL